MKKPGQNLFYVLGFLAVSVFGFGLALRSWDGVVYFYSSSKRNPAAISRVFDFSHLEGTALMNASKNRMISDARVLTEEDSLGIELGHFVIRNAQGRKSFACENFDKVKVVFISLGSAVSGEPSQLSVTGDCTASQDTNRIDPLWIPKHMAGLDGLGESKYSDTPQVQLFNTPSNLPENWQLSKVKLYNSQNLEEEMEVSAKGLLEEGKTPIQISIQR